MHKIGADAALVNVDCSEAQLDMIDKNSISPVCISLRMFGRNVIEAELKRCLFLMRSSLHYLGEDGVTPFLRCHRNQAWEGEYVLHQSASFDNEGEAVCLNALHRYMFTDKWYPTVDDLQKRLAKSGWRVTARATVPSLISTSDDLSRRYALDINDLVRNRNKMA